ncbi:hypothetical protein CK203_106804 [Vitis vinifera]|uniref:Retrovirus-related Pol polyprotein from transposon RE2 n=1 Tax=Vitis vinifera TaxID=29760 RepID=A0A438CQ59_VITVI|nr:hypothetical protein CK203_106804 [Vitis vinifera]
MLAATPNHQDSWFFDTGATHHLSHSAQTLSHVQPYSGADQVTIGDGHSLPILNTDQVTKQTLLKGWLRDGLYEFLLLHLLMLLCLQAPFLLSLLVQFGIPDLDTHQLLFFPRL